MFCLLCPPVSQTVDRGGKGVTKTALHFLWVLLGALSSALAEMQFPLILLRGQNAPLQGICENPFSFWFPDKGIYTHILSLEHSSREWKPKVFLFKAYFPKATHIQLATQGSCPPLSPTIPKMPSLNKLRPEKESTVPGQQSLPV